MRVSALVTLVSTRYKPRCQIAQGAFTEDAVDVTPRFAVLVAKAVCIQLTSTTVVQKPAQVCPILIEKRYLCPRAVVLNHRPRVGGR